MSTTTATATKAAGSAGRRVTVTYPDGTRDEFGSKPTTHLVVGWAERYDVTTGKLATHWWPLRSCKSAAAAHEHVRFYDAEVRAHVVEVADPRRLADHEENQRRAARRVPGGRSVWQDAGSI